MDKGIFRYLEFLLPVHNCVTIPDFGGFIVNVKPSISIDNVMPPQFTIVFNPDLNHNDGIIASYISKNENISYNAACNKIKDFVKDLKTDLKAGKIITCNNIGELTTDDNGNPVFSPNRNMTYPALYGLSPIQMKQLVYIDNNIRKEKRNISIKYVLGGVAATIAAIFLFAGPNANITDRNYSPSANASFISSLATSLPSLDNNIIEENTLNKPIVTIENEVNTPVRTYYIIIGGEDSKPRAERLLKKIKNDDFPDASMVESPGRYRIYISSFDNKDQAEDYLDSFRKENPKYQTAWLYSQRNK